MDNLRAGPTDPPCGPFWGGGRGEQVRRSYCREGKIKIKTPYGPIFNVYCIQDRVLMVVPAPPINMKKLHTVR